MTYWLCTLRAYLAEAMAGAYSLAGDVLEAVGCIGASASVTGRAARSYNRAADHFDRAAQNAGGM
jgi:hypothetical protein